MAIEDASLFRLWYAVLSILFRLWYAVLRTLFGLWYAVLSTLFRLWYAVLKRYQTYLYHYQGIFGFWGELACLRQLAAQQVDCHKFRVLSFSVTAIINIIIIILSIVAIFVSIIKVSLNIYSVRSNCSYKGKNTPWPPFKMPGKIHVAYSKLYGILNCATMHAFLFSILHKVGCVSVCVCVYVCVCVCVCV